MHNIMQLHNKDKEAIFISKATKEKKVKKKALKTKLRLKGCPTIKGKGLKSAII